MGFYASPSLPWYASAYHRKLISQKHERLVARGEQQFIMNQQEHNRSWKASIDVLRPSFEMCHVLQCYGKFCRFLYAIVWLVCYRYLRSFSAATATVTVIADQYLNGREAACDYFCDNGILQNHRVLLSFERPSFVYFRLSNRARLRFFRCGRIVKCRHFS